MRRTALRILVASVAASALVGVVILLAGQFGEIEVKVLGTALCVSLASVLAMACAPAWERQRLMPVPPLALGASVLGLALCVAFVWTEAQSQGAWKLATSFVVLGAAGTHASLLSLADPAPQHRWVRRGAFVASAILSVLVLGIMWEEEVSEGLWRVVGALSILLAAFTVLVPVLQRMHPRASASCRPALRHCPACAAPLPAPSATSCAACQACFEVVFHSPGE